MTKEMEQIRTELSELEERIEKLDYDDSMQLGIIGRDRRRIDELIACVAEIDRNLKQVWEASRAHHSSIADLEKWCAREQHTTNESLDHFSGRMAKAERSVVMWSIDGQEVARRVDDAVSCLSSHLTEHKDRVLDSLPEVMDAQAERIAELERKVESALTTLHQQHDEAINGPTHAPCPRCGGERLPHMRYLSNLDGSIGAEQKWRIRCVASCGWQQSGEYPTAEAAWAAHDG